MNCPCTRVFRNQIRTDFWSQYQHSIRQKIFPCSLDKQVQLNSTCADPDLDEHHAICSLYIDIYLLTRRQSH